MLLAVLRLTRVGFRAAWVIAILALIALTTTPAILRAAGVDTYTVRGGSMSPAIPLGAVVFVQHVAPASVNAGDVISFKANNDTVVTHRVMGRSAGSDPTFITQGDANPTPDPDFVPSSSVIGRVLFVVPVAGAAMVALSTTLGMVVVGALLVTLLVAGWFVEELRGIVAANTRRAATELAG